MRRTAETPVRAYPMFAWSLIIGLLFGCGGPEGTIPAPGSRGHEREGARAEEAGETVLPEIICRKVPRSLALSGRLDDPLWREAEPRMLQDAVTGEKGRFSTEVRALFSDDYLYVGFTCEDDSAWGTYTDRDSPVYREECVEIFVCPSGKTHQYFEINVSPLNVLFDACILNGRTARNPRENFRGWHGFDFSDIHVLTSIETDPEAPGLSGSWRAEFAVPIAELWGAPHVPPQDGDVWRINFYRIDSPDRKAAHYYAWSPVHEVNFHQPWKFGRLLFRIEEMDEL